MVKVLLRRAHARRVLGAAGTLALVLMLAFAATVASMGAAHAAPAEASMAYVRVVHAAPAAPNVDVYLDNSKLLNDFAFGTVTDYVPVAAGQHTIEVVPAGQAQSKAVITQTVTVNAGTWYTVAAIGDSNTTPALVAFVDDNSVASGMAKARVYHLSSDAGPVAVATGGNTVIPSLTFKNASNYLTVQPGSYTFDVTLLNMNNKMVQTMATLEANKVTSIFALGQVNGSGNTAFKFVTATVAGVPTGMPSTGFAPAQQGPSAALWLALGAIALLIVAGAGVVVARQPVAERE